MKRLLILLTLIGCGQPSSGPGSFQSLVAPRAPIVTMSGYSKIADGMSYSQVESIVGTAGTEEARQHMAGVPGVMESVTTVSYRWINDDGSNMSTMFQNDKMMMKAQAGLK